tara:strand:- start:4367 stop:5257 length:891 start_codon:yes stop_codon:yes gene_type:complete
MEKLNQPAPIAVVGTVMKTAFASQTWSLQAASGRLLCHCFLIEAGSAVVSLTDGNLIELAAPAVLWVPAAMGGEFRLAAGSSGIEVTASQEFVWRTIGDSAVAVDLKSLMEEMALASGGSLPLDELRACFGAIVREARAPEPGGASIMGFSLGLVMLHLWRAVSARRSQSSLWGGGSALVQRFRQMVEIHYRDRLRTAAYAEALGVTPAKLADACRKVERLSPKAIVHNRILEEAQRRLAQTEMSVEQVAFSLGFRDPPYFNRFFTRMTGSSPGAFRKAALRANQKPASSSFAAWP